MAGSGFRSPTAGRRTRAAKELTRLGRLRRARLRKSSVRGAPSGSHQRGRLPWLRLPLGFSSGRIALANALADLTLVFEIHVLAI